ncbi:MAG: endonuclease [Burkholderiales bacterium]|jgi:phosphatidylserine/phosphatidylglycerophosphate/cardiolipin synthase-like enzyme|nr:endonuclease [Burkholderiales bacterium]
MKFLKTVFILFAFILSSCSDGRNNVNVSTINNNGELLSPSAGSTIDIGFSPEHTSLPVVLKVIDSAKYSICVAAYSFTSKPISQALYNAAKRGVNVRIVADAKSNKGRYTATTFLANHGLDVRLNGNYAIMHNKFMVIDDKTVETGSFNYSAAAVKNNAENVIVIWNNPQVASRYKVECNRLLNEAAKLPKSY